MTAKIHGHRAAVEYSSGSKEVALSSVTYGSYVIPQSGPLQNEICIWTYTRELVPLSSPGKMLKDGLDIDSFTTLVVVLDKGQRFTVTIEGVYE